MKTIYVFIIRETFNIHFYKQGFSNIHIVAFFQHALLFLNFLSVEYHVEGRETTRRLTALFHPLVFSNWQTPQSF